MPKLNTTVKSVRIDNDILEKLEKQLDGKTFNYWLNEKIREEVEKPSGDFSTPSGKELLSMLSCFRKSGEEFIEDSCRLMEEGTLTYENGKLKAVSFPNMGEYEERFLEWCKSKRVDPQKVFTNLMAEVSKELEF